jgi:hypothetical protein
MCIHIDVKLTSFSEHQLATTAQFTAKPTPPLSSILLTKNAIAEHLPKYTAIYLCSAAPTSSSSLCCPVLFLAGINPSFNPLNL